MTQNEQTRALAVFFIMTCLDEVRAREAASKAADELDRLRKKSPEQDPQKQLIESCFLIWKKQKLFHGRRQIFNGNRENWIFPKNLSLGPWKDFQRAAPENEILAVTFVHILGFSIANVAYVLGCSEGTIRYRVARALRRISQNLSTQGTPLRGVDA